MIQDTTPVTNGEVISQHLCGDEECSTDCERCAAGHCKVCQDLFEDDLREREHE